MLYAPLIVKINGDHGGVSALVQFIGFYLVKCTYILVGNQFTG